MCMTAKLNGFKTTGLGDNCNIPPAVRKNDTITREDFIIHHNLQFVAQENKPFRLNESSNKFVYMTTFRNPMDRLVSHLHHEFCYNGKPMKDRLEHHLCYGVPETLSDLINNPCFMGSHMRGITTDYYLSMMTGCVNRMTDENGSLLPPKKNTCNETHLKEAKRLLNYFSVILISDHAADFDK